MTVNWGEAFKVAGPILGSMAQGKTQNRAWDNATNLQMARDAENAAVNRARANVEAGTLDVARQREAREAQAQAIRNAMTAAMLGNMSDVSVDRSQFRSRVPDIRFAGGSRPSAMGPGRGELGAVLNNQAMQTLMAPPPSPTTSSQAVPRNGGVMPDYVPAEQSKGGFWENALGIAGLGSSIGGALMKKAAPAAAGAAGAGNYVQQGVSQVANRVGGATAGQIPAMTGPFGSTPVTMSPPPGVAEGISNAGALSNPSSFLGTANQIAGPAGLGLSIASNFMPEGKAKTAANWAGTGAQIGSFVPGVGTALGAAGGAIAGAIKGHQNATKGAREDFAKSMGYRTLDQLYKALDGMGPEGQELKNRALNVIGKQDQKGNQQWMGQVQYLLGRR